MLRALIPLIFSPLLASVDMQSAIQELQAIQPSAETMEKACSLKNDADEFIRRRREELLHDSPQETDFFVFVSTSMHKNQLLEMGLASKRHGGVLVLRGLVDASFKATLRELSYLFKEEVGVLIDPQLFEDHNVQHVPTFILTDGKQSDYMSGSVSPQYALETFSERGDLGQEAKRRLTP